MKHILLLTLAVATAALMGGCASHDYGPGNQDQSNHYEQQPPSMGGGGY